MIKQSFHKTRIAPTPSGYLHLGNAYSFLLTQAIAEKEGAKILLRIDDLDVQRIRKEYVQDIFETLAFLNINIDEGPQNEEEYESSRSQLKRMDLYNQSLQQLREEELVYACNCSRTKAAVEICNCRGKEISLDEKDTAWKLITDDDKEISMNIYGGATFNRTLPASMKDFIVRKKDGLPAYQLASLTDDIHFRTDLVIRGADLRNSSLGQLYLADKLNLSSFNKIVFHHHSLLRDGEGNKFSKSSGALSVQHIRKESKNPAVIFEMLGKMIGAEMPVSTAMGLKELLLQRLS